MADREIERWEKAGAVFLWHYKGFPSNYCGYHVAADSQGCLFLMGLIERFWKARYPARKQIRLDVPTPAVLSVPNCPRECIPAETLELRFRRDHPDDHWSLTENQRRVTIEMGASGLRDLERGVADMVQADGDWSTGCGDQSLWFWWHPDTVAKSR